MNTETNATNATTETNATSSATSSAALVTISSVVPTTPAMGNFTIVARWKNGKNPDGSTKLVSDANRARCIELPQTLWNESFMQNESQVFILFIREAIEELAKQYLSKICEDSNMQRKQVPASDFKLSALLQWNQEQAAISGRLNGDEIKAWLSQSATVRAVEATHGKDIAIALGVQFVKLASPNHGLTSAKAEKLLATLFKPEDADTTTGLRVMLRLQAIRDRTENTQINALDSIL